MRLPLLWPLPALLPPSTAALLPPSLLLLKLKIGQVKYLTLFSAHHRPFNFVHVIHVLLVNSLGTESRS